MTASEFESEFDILYNNICSNQAPELDSYEKSVLLTKAQDDILKSYFDPRLNKPQEGYDSSERRQIDFSMITISNEYVHRELSAEGPSGPSRPVEPDPIQPLIDILPAGSDFIDPKFDTRDETKAVNVKDSILMVINEYLIVKRSDENNETKDVRLEVTPLQYSEYSRLMTKPYKRPSKWQAWRLIDSSNNKRTFELIVGPGDKIYKYYLRYVKKPRPIIIGELYDKTIEDYDKVIDEKNPCELDPIIHPEIVQRAVEMASAIYKADLNTQIAIGTSSQTDIGMLTQSK